MTWIAGVDGCRSGWFVVLIEYDGTIRQERHEFCVDFHRVLELQSGSAITAIDIPIGLLAANVPGGRDCDKEARRMLGKPRSNSVFSPPIRPALHAANYEEAKRINGISRQAHALCPKIGEVDQKMNRALQERVHEVHPEVCFWAMANGQAMQHRKKTPKGKDERLKWLEDSTVGFRGLKAALKARSAGVGCDDVIDAYAAVWTGIRIAEGKARRIPGNPPLDGEGLRMEMWY
jgi:predicted RNase H-like nuclease